MAFLSLVARPAPIRQSIHIRVKASSPMATAGCEPHFSRTFPLKDGRQVTVRSAAEEDLEDMSQMAHEAFVASGVRLPPREEYDFFTGFFSMCLQNCSPMLVACDGSSGARLGSVACVTGGEKCSGLGPVTVGPVHQGRGIGRALMVAIMDHVKSTHDHPLTFRLTQEAANTVSFCLYASLGFKACGNLLEFQGLPSQVSGSNTTGNSQASSVKVRRATEEDVSVCDMLFQEAHGGDMGCSNDIRKTVLHGAGVYGCHAYVLTDSKDGSVIAYTTGLHVHGHTVARDKATFKLFLEKLSVEVTELEREVCGIYIDPVRYPDLVRWMLAAKMRVEKQHTMMTTGGYTAPVASFVYCPTLDY